MVQSSSTSCQNSAIWYWKEPNSFVNTPALALLMFYSEGRYFLISLSGRDMSMNVWNRLSGSSMVGTGISSDIMKSPSPECYTSFWRMTIYSDTLHSDITPILTPLLNWTLYRSLLLPNWARIEDNICNGCGMPTENAYSFGYLVMSHIWTCMCSNVESLTCLDSGLLSFKHSSVLLF